MNQDILDQSTNIHLVGIKGVGMTPLALILKSLGKKITGSDTLEYQITDPVLSKHNIQSNSFSPKNITTNTDLVIFSGAYQRTKHPELTKASSIGVPLLTQAQVLASLTNLKKTIAICGVGGKTTTSAMLAGVFSQLGLKPSWFVGVSTFNGKQPGKFDQGQHFITEADEYAIEPGKNNKPKFSLLKPHAIICTNLVHDHPDIYPNFKSTQQVFLNFFKKLTKNSPLILSDQVKLTKTQVNSLTTRNIITYGTSRQSDWRIKPEPNNIYHIQHNNLTLKLKLTVPGLFNAYNATAALALSNFYHLDLKNSILALNQFSGSARRQELIKDKQGILYFDDYAHHPLEIEYLLQAFKSTFPKRRLIAVFHPHTFSRTKTFINEFSQCFHNSDHLIITKIFSSERETQQANISGKILAKAIKKNHPNTHFIANPIQIVKYLNKIKKRGDLILTIGAGDIYKIHQHL